MELLIGAAVSLLIQWVKKYGKNQWTTLLFLLIASLVASSLYTLLVDVGYWETVASIIMTAGAFYAFILQRFE